MSLTSQIKTWYIRHLPGMNNKLEERELQAKLRTTAGTEGVLQERYVVQAQNVRFETDPGGVSKRDPVTKFNGTSMGSGEVLGLFRYYTSGGATLFMTTHGTDCYVGSDAAGTFTSVKASLTSGKRMSFITYKDLVIGSNGYDNPFVYDGASDNVSWELGACKTVIGDGTGITQTAVSYQITIDADTYVCGAVSNTIATLSNEDVDLTNIPTGPVGTVNRKIYRKDSNTAGGYKLVATLNDNTTTIYSDTTDDVSGGDALPAVTDDMPVGNILQMHRERLFISGDPSNVNRIYYSNPYLPWYIQQTVNLDYMDVAADDSDEISGIPIHFGIMICIKKNSLRKIHVTTPVSGAAPASWYADDPVSFIGSPAPWSITQTPYGVMFLGWDHWYLFDGTKPIPIIDEFDTNDVLRGRYSETIGYWHRGTLLAAYTDAEGGSQYHDRVMRYNMLRKKMSYDLLDANCFAAKRGDDESGEIYYGHSTTGWVLMAQNEELFYRLRTKTGCDIGTELDTFVGGLENSPTIAIGEAITALGIPDDIIIFWDNEDDDPGTQWTEITAYDDKFIKFSATSAQTGGAVGHTHQVTGTLEDNTRGETVYVGDGLSIIADEAHTHDVAITSVSTAAEPRHVNLRMFKKNNSGADTEFPLGSILMYGQPGAPEGWQAFDHVGYYIRIDSAGTDLGVENASVHDHTFAGNSDPTTLTAANSDGGTYGYHSTHAHSVAGTAESADLSDWELAYADFRFIKKVGEVAAWDGTDLYVYAMIDSTATATNNWSDVTDTYADYYLKIGNSQVSTTAASGASHTHVVYDGTSGDNNEEGGNGGVNAQGPEPHSHPWTLTGEAADADEPAYVTMRVFRMVLGKMKNYNDAYITQYTYGLWESPGIQLNAKTLSKIAWNESVVSGDTIEFHTRTGATQSVVEDATTCVASAANNNFNHSGHGLSNTNRVVVGGTAVPTGILDDYVYHVVGVSGTSFQVALHAGSSAVTFSDAGTAVDFKKWSAALSNPNGSAIADTANVWFQYLIAYVAVSTTAANPYVYHTDGYVVRVIYSKGATIFETAVEMIYDIGWRNFYTPMVDKIFKRIISVHEGDTGSFTLYWETENASSSFTIDLTAYPKTWDSYFPDDAMGKELKLKIYKNDLYDFKLKELKGLYTPEPIIV